jgi:hypothetical protein
VPENIGGGAKKVEISLYEIGEKLDRAFAMGVEAGRDAERRLARLAEVNDCPMCALKDEAEALRQRLAIREHPHRKSRNVS